MEARHINNNRQDNRASNLAWGTDQENTDDRIAAGTIARGERTNRTTLMPADIPIIRSMIPKDAAQRFGISIKSAEHIKARRRW